MVKIDSIEDVKKLLNNQHQSQNQIQVGYGGETNDKPIRKVGDKWTDSDGNEWEQKEGYSMKLGKEWQQELHHYLNSFSKCPKETCTCTMPKNMDEKMKMIHGMCFDCVIDMEHKIRLEGRWDEYEREKMKENALAWLAEAEKDKNLIAEELSKLEFANSFGDSEKWSTGKTKEELLQKIEEEFEKFRQDFIQKLENNSD
jgi:DNA-directed RNA polymerase subunit F